MAFVPWCQEERVLRLRWAVYLVPIWIGVVFSFLLLEMMVRRDCLSRGQLVCILP